MPIEGFWAQSPNDSSGLPFPVPFREDWDKEGFLAQLDKVEANAQRRNYRGMSSCRVCKCHNGSAEFSSGEYSWPAGYRHYIAEHDVRPTPGFEKMIRTVGAELPDKPTKKPDYPHGLRQG